ncbi:MAG: hypothetical protein IPK82_32795 [Polyangiaceae bacterium]|nr:hypothetical protein [Polyangiaceae bacterium]
MLYPRSCLLLAIGMLTLVGCSGSTEPTGAGGTGEGGGPGGAASGQGGETFGVGGGGGENGMVEPISAPNEEWTWIPFDDAFCANGTTTGIGANLTDKSSTVVIYLMGGGACWDNLTCYIANTAVNIASGYGETNFAQDSKYLSGSLFNRTNSQNPLRNASYFFVPYCTGDVHAGNNPDAVYDGQPTKHVGFKNIESYLKRIAATFPNADRVILSGSSAGGFGAGLNLWQAQKAFGSVRVDLVDDSGPPLPSPYLSETLEGQWRAAWNLSATLPENCAECQTDLSGIFGFYSQQLPNSRVALLSYTHDQVIADYFFIPTDKVAEGLGVLAAELDGYANTRYYFAAGSDHVLLGTPETISQNGVPLFDWLTKMVTDDPAWANVKP